VENRGGSHASSEECSCGDTQNEELNWKGCARGRAAWGGQDSGQLDQKESAGGRLQPAK